MYDICVRPDQRVPELCPFFEILIQTYTNKSLFPVTWPRGGIEIGGVEIAGMEIGVIEMAGPEIAGMEIRAMEICAMEIRAMEIG